MASRKTPGPGVRRRSPSSEQPPSGPSELILYTTPDHQTRIEVRLENETVWLSQRQLAELFQRSVKTTNEHIGNVYDEGELEPGPTIRKSRIVQTEGDREVTREVELYNLDVIISVGYRVKSHRGTQFRIWATQRLREYLVKGFALDDERLKEIRTLPGGRDYFDELLERIRDIRASERRFYQKICDIYTTSVDYDPTTDAAQKFFATVQNKLHWAIHGRTAAQLISERADATKPHMGLTTWKNAPAGPIRKADAEVAKNYLTVDEIRALNLLVDQYLSFAELQAQQRKAMTMAAWATKLDGFLKLNDRDILADAGRLIIPAQEGETVAHECGSPVLAASAADLTAVAAIGVRRILDDHATPSATNHWLWTIAGVPDRPGLDDSLAEVRNVLPPHRDCQTYAPSPVVDIVMDARVHDFIERQARERLPNETGGIPVGHIRGDVVHVTAASDSGPAASESPSGFLRDGKHCRSFLEEAMTSSDGAVTYVGERHSHPQHGAMPSHTDVTSLADISTDQNFNTPAPVMLIVALETAEGSLILHGSVYPAHRRGFVVPVRAA